MVLYKLRRKANELNGYLEALSFAVTGYSVGGVNELLSYVIL
jgi:hypothetical protein